MPRVQRNTVTKTPMLMTEGGTNRRLPNIRLSTGRAEALTPLIERETRTRKRNLGEAERSVQQFGHLMRVVADTGQVAGKLMDRAIALRDDTFATGKAAAYQEAVTEWETGMTADGRQVGSLLETPYTPGDESGEGMAGSTVAIAEAHKNWMEEQQFSPRQLELVQQKIEPMRLRVFAAAQRVDQVRHEQHRTEQHAMLSRAQADNYYKTGDTASLNEAALTFALANLPRADVKNVEDWEATGERDPARLQFANEGAQGRFDALFTEAHEKIQQKHVNLLLDEAVNTEDAAVSAGLFETFRGSLDPESDTGAFFIQEENQEALKKALRGATEQRKSVVARRTRERFDRARDLSARVVIGQAGEADMQALEQVREMLPAERLLEIDQFTDRIADQLSYGDWETFRRKTLYPEAGDADPQPQAQLEALQEYAQGLKHPAARERALVEVERMRQGLAPKKSGATSDTIKDKRLELLRRFGGQAPAEELETLVKLAEEGRIGPEQFVKHVDDMRKLALNTIEPAGLLDAMTEAGFSVDGYFDRDDFGNIRLGTDGLPKSSQPDYKAEQKGWTKDHGHGFWNRQKDYWLTEELMLKAYDLAREYKAQELTGVKARESLPEFLQKRLMNMAVGKNWSDEQIGLKIRTLDQTLRADYETSVGGFYHTLLAKEAEFEWDSDEGEMDDE